MKKPPRFVVVAEVPAVVREALAVAPRPFEPAGTLSLKHPRPILPSLVVLARTGRRWADIATEVLPAVRAGMSLYIAFEDAREFQKVAAEMAEARV